MTTHTASTWPREHMTPVHLDDVISCAFFETDQLCFYFTWIRFYCENLCWSFLDKRQNKTLGRFFLSCFLEPKSLVEFSSTFKWNSDEVTLNESLCAVFDGLCIRKVQPITASRLFQNQAHKNICWNCENVKVMRFYFVTFLFNKYRFSSTSSRFSLVSSEASVDVIRSFVVRRWRADPCRCSHVVSAASHWISFLFWCSLFFCWILF